MITTDKDRPFRFMSRRRSAPALALAASVPWLAPGAAKPVIGETDRYTTGRLLVASENMDDPQLARTVILMVRHDMGGAFGQTLNRRVGRVGVAEFMRRTGISVGGSVRKDEPIDIHFGGPVHRRRAFVIHTPDFHGDGTTVVNGHASVTANFDVLKAVA